MSFFLNWIFRKVDKTVPGSDSGWLYGYDFRTLDVREDKAGSANTRHFVRRKRWVRRVALILGENADDEGSRDGSLMSDTLEGGYAPSIISSADFYTPTLSQTFQSHPISSSLGSSGVSIGSFDDNEVEEDEEETDEAVFQTLLNLNEYHSSNIAILKDNTLLNIGKKMRQLEAECKKDDELKVKDFHKNIEPSYKKTIKELEQRIAELKKRITNEITMGNEHIALLEKELQAHIEVEDSTKRSLYFPFSNVTLGSGGVYFALDDFWLEYGSGQFILDFVPSRETPHIIVLLTGAAEGNDSGHICIFFHLISP
jgi:hypothetical protein